MPDAAPDLSLAERIDAVCDQFERDFRAGKKPRIESCLGESQEPFRSTLVKALVGLELELRQKRGETPQPAEYISRFPHHADAVQQAFTEVRSILSSVKVFTAETSKGPSAAQPGSASTSQPMEKLGRFQILSVLGEGAFGTVYKAHDPQLDRDIALKVPRFGALQSPDDRERFLREARAAAGLHHAQICPVHEVGTIDGRDYIVMAFIDGKPLNKILQAQTKLSDKQVVSVIRKLALALQEAHDKGIIHRDLKPANIMINRKGEPVIMDFGLARRSNAGDAQISQSGQIMGTPAYMSPEQARGDSKAVGHSADIYSLGVVFYEMLCGRRPFEGTITEVIGQILHVDADPPSMHRPGVDLRLEAICMKAIAKKSSDRYASMKDFAAALADYVKTGSTVQPKASATALEPVQGEALHTKQFAKLMAAVSSDLEEKVERAASRAVRKSHKPPKVPWWTYLVGSGLMGVIVLLGIFFFIRKDTVTVIVNIPDIDPKDPTLSFLLDNKPVSAEAFASPIELKPGEHELIVNKDGKQFKQFLFNVGKADNQPIIVQDVTPKSLSPEMVLERLQGRWMAVEQARGGEKLNAEALKAENKVMTISNNRFSIEYHLPQNQSERGTEMGIITRIDPNTLPGEIDMVFERGAAGPLLFKGIFEFNGDRLRHCYRKCHEEVCSRPTDFTTAKGQAVFYVEYAKAPPSAGPRRVEVKELNLTGYDTFPSLSIDGKRMYFESKKPETDQEMQMWVWVAERTDANRPFANKRALFPARHPTLTGDELEMVFIRGKPGGSSLRFAKRNSMNENFAPSGEIPELLGQPNPKSPMLYEDGLMLVFQRGHADQNNIELVYCTRPNRTSPWSQPIKAHITPDPTWTEPITWPFQSRDELTLWYCHGGDMTPEIRVATRLDRTSSFGNHQPVIVEGTPLIGRSPRFVEATGELFYSANTTQDAGRWSLWVVKDYQPPVRQSNDRVAAEYLFSVGAELKLQGHFESFGKMRRPLPEGTVRVIWVDFFDHKDIPRKAFETTASLPELLGIHLHRCRFSAGVLAQLAGCPKLNDIDVPDCGLHDADLEQILTTPTLVAVAINGNPVGRESFQRIAQNKRIARLNLHFTGLGDDDLQRLCDALELTELHLDGNPLTEAALKTLESERSLKHLYLDAHHSPGGKISRKSLQQLKRARPDCNIIPNPDDDLPADAQIFNGHSYKFFPEQLTWKDAKAKCEALGGHLIIVDNLDENAFAAKLVAAAGWVDAWIGATDEAKEADWRTVKGNPLPFVNWHTDQPNNKPPGEHWALMSNKQTPQGLIGWKWSDQPNASTQHKPGYLCEWDAVATADAKNSDRQVAEWVINQGGSIRTTDSQDPLGLIDLNNYASQLPAGNFPLKGVFLGNGGKPASVKITDDDLQRYRGLTKLKYLDLGSDGVQIAGPGVVHLVGLPKLEELHFYYCPLQNEGLLHVGRMRGLRSLRVDATFINDEGVAHLRELTELRRLVLGFNRVSGEGLKHLAGMKNLEWLNIYGTDVTDDDLVHLMPLTSLRMLEVGRHRRPNFTGAGFAHLRPLKSLRDLDVFDADITDDGLRGVAALESLEGLNLLGTKITDAGLKHLYGLKSLRRLNVGMTAVTDEGVRQLREALPDCQIAK